MKYIFYIFFFIFLYACSNTTVNESKVIQVTSTELNINIGYNTARINIGTFIKNNKNYFYFYHHLYTDYISIYDDNSLKIDSINVKVNIGNNEIVGVKFLNSDTILLRSKRNILYLINNRSEILKVFDLNNVSSFGIDSTYEIYNDLYYLDNNKYLFITNYNDKDNPYKDNIDYCKYLKYYVEKSFISNRFLIVKDTNNKHITIKHTLNNFENNYTDIHHFSMINPQIYVKYPYIFVYTIYSEQVSVYSIQNDSIVNKFKIKSKYLGNLYTMPFKMDSMCLDKLESNSYTGKNGSLLDMFYSEYTKKYYFFIRLSEKLYGNKRYSIVSTDASFNKDGETNLFNIPKAGILWTNRGIYISDDNVNPRSKKLNYKYYEFTK